MNRPDEPTFVNPNDWASNFWGKNYRVSLDLGVAFWVNASYEQAALDEVIDYCEIHCPGFIASIDDLDADELDEAVTGGNHGLVLTSDVIIITEV